MLNTKKHLLLIIVVSILIVLFATFGALLYIESRGIESIFNIPQKELKDCYLTSVIFFALAGGLFVLVISLLVFYFIGTSHNKKTIRLIKELKHRFAHSKNVTVAEVNKALKELRIEIAYAKKHGLTINRQPQQAGQQPIVVSNNYEQQVMPNQKTVTTTTTYNTTTVPNQQQMPGMMVPPPPPVRTANPGRPLPPPPPPLAYNR